MKIKGKVFLAPMSRVTIMPFRVLCREYGADYVCTEMINATALARRNKVTLRLLEHCDEERPVGVQLFGANTEAIVKSAKIVRDDFDFIDFNLGCPSVDVMKCGGGAALLKRKNKIEEIISGLVKIGKPITAKIRICPNAVEICKTLERAGADAVTVHGRRVEQGYSGRADWDAIKTIKESVNISIIGNGDVFSGSDAKRMLDYCGCDAVMVGRGAIGNPAIFKEIKNVLEGKRVISYGDKDKINDFLKMELDAKNSKLQAVYFTKGVSGGAQVREKLQKCKTEEEVKDIMESLKKAISEA